LVFGGYADFSSFALACPQDQFVTASGIALGAPGVELDLTAGGAAPSGQVFDLGSEAGMINAEGFVFKPDWVRRVTVRAEVAVHFTSS
jgi:hypothetical protein